MQRVSIESPDDRGWCGFTMSGPAVVGREPENFDGNGFKVRHEVNNGDIYYQLSDSDVVCFVSEVDDERGCHSAIMLDTPHRFAFPPNTLYHLVSVQDPGTWAVDHTIFPPNTPTICPRQRLLTVKATYRAPRSAAPKKSRGPAPVDIA